MKLCVRTTNSFRGAWLGVGVRLPVADQQVEQRTWVVWLVSSADCSSVRTSKNLIDEGVARSLAGLGWQFWRWVSREGPHGRKWGRGLLVGWLTPAVFVPGVGSKMRLLDRKKGKERLSRKTQTWKNRCEGPVRREAESHRGGGEG